MDPKTGFGVLFGSPVKDPEKGTEPQAKTYPPSSSDSTCLCFRMGPRSEGETCHAGTRLMSKQKRGWGGVVGGGRQSTLKAVHASLLADVLHKLAATGLIVPAASIVPQLFRHSVAWKCQGTGKETKHFRSATH